MIFGEVSLGNWETKFNFAELINSLSSYLKKSLNGYI